MLELTQISTGYEVSFTYKPWLVDAIKTIPGARWNPSRKNWFVPNKSSSALLNWSKQIGGKVAAPTKNIEIGEIEPLPELDIEIPLKRSLYHYQAQGVAYALKHKKVIVGDEPGLGKTFQSIATLVAANVKCVLVICPATLKDNWVNEWRMNAGWSAIEITDRIKLSWGQYYRVGMCKVFVVNYESLKKYFVESINKPEDKPLRLNHIKFRDTINLFDAVIIDELHRCFPFETKILTNRGWFEIGEIVENNRTDLLALSYDFSNNSLSLKSIKNVWKNEIRDRKLLKIKYNGGNLIATEDHEVYTYGGWKKKVSEIKSGDYLPLLQDAFLNEESWENNSEILFKKLLFKNNKLKSRDSKKNGQEQEKANDRKEVCFLRKRVQGSFARNSIGGKKVLLKKLFCKVACKTAGNNSNKQNGIQKGKSKNKCYKANARPQIKANAFRKNEAKQSHAISRIEGKIIKAFQREAVYGSKSRKWKFNRAAIDTKRSSRVIKGKLGISNKDIASKRRFPQLPKLLQVRHSYTTFNAFNRSRWAISQYSKSEKDGRIKNQNIEFVRVESIEVYQQADNDRPSNGSFRNKIVYDLEVADTHNYFANGILVSNCKSSKTMQSKLVAGICKGKEYILGLTGTPIQNKPADLWPQLGIIQQIENFGGYKGFVDRYCDGPTQSSNLKELNYLLNKHCFYRRSKRDVLKDLPKLTRNIHKVSISNRTEYVKAENNFIEYLRENLQKTEGEIDTALRGQAMVLIGILKKISARGKIEQVLEHIQEVTDAGEKIVVFCWHKEIVDELKKHLPNAVTVVGSDPQEKRQAAVHDFQKCKKCNTRLENHKDTGHDFIPSDTKVIICNIKSGGVGITLTASSRVIHHELPWTAADCEQDESRCDRISQRFPVESGYFLGANTIDEYIYELIDKKRNIANQVTGAVEEVETNMVDEFINLFTKAKF